MSRLEALLQKAEDNPSQEKINDLLTEITHPYDEEKDLMHTLASVETGKVVFIDGLFRSGTTLIQKLLRDSNLNTIELYHIVSYDQLLYNYKEGREQLAKRALIVILDYLGAQTREYDNIEIDSSTVDEYGHIIASSDKPDDNVVSRIKYALSFEKRHRVSEKNKEKFVEIIKKLRHISDNDNPIVLKNPFDFPNTDYIHEVLPDAKHIFLRRFAPRAIASLFKALRTDYDRKEPVLYLYLINDYYKNTFNDSLVKKVITYASRARLSIPILTLRAANEVRQHKKNSKLIPEENYFTTSYKKLTDKPNETIDSILEFLDIESNHPDFRKRIKKRSYKLPRLIKVFQPAIEALFNNYHIVD